jgi:hypothetical protein
MLRVELLKGREIPGKQSSWLVTLKGFKTREEVITFFQVMFCVSRHMLCVCDGDVHRHYLSKCEIPNLESVAGTRPVSCWDPQCL